jgi:hypothetical protein
MSERSAIDDLRNARDAALDALADAITALGNIIAQTTQKGPYLDQLTRRYQELMNLRNAIWAATTDPVLAVPNIVAAAATLNTLSAQMKTTAQELSDATNVLAKTATVLSLGQQFSYLIATAQKE